MERILDENQPREQAGFRKNFSTTDHLQALNQLIEKCNEYNLPLCLGFIDYEKAFDSVEYETIVQALRKVNINENYVTMIESIAAKELQQEYILTAKYQKHLESKEE
ncbi:retrovirus-related pol polyprotein from type-1 retrotransposable element r2 [Plakobranchus ocellatus]|uniref:Retrovirus-related pol polyprotein from type-1 retrotransposable element r2 n=1 Tax=Plakobranchus ocellatus TaxID=259542 RepID=A0AAV4DN89_9GAST|nr:retrovirus-related pol polyprotein from type-1 retrotransposable element r2 [Plakobranchus ocellatus]